MENKDVTIFTSMDEAREYVKELLEMKPGTCLGKDDDGCEVFFAGVVPDPSRGLRVMMMTVGTSTEASYKGQPVVDVFAAEGSIVSPAKLLGRGIRCSYEDIEEE